MTRTAGGGDGWLREQRFDLRGGRCTQDVARWDVLTEGTTQPEKVPSPEAQAHWDEAIDQFCMECLIFVACHAQRMQHRLGVWGGTDQHQRWLENQRLKKGRLRERRAREAAAELEQAEREVPALAEPSPLKPRKKTAFPAGDPAKGDGWIRDHRGVAPAFYEATTPDGVWMRMKVKATASRQTIKWLLADDVDLRRTVQVIHIEFVNRPDGKRRHGKAA